MTSRDFWLFAMVNLIWAGNNIVSKLVVSQFGLPPIAFAALRFLVVLALVFPFLGRMPRPRWRILAIALFMGALQFCLLFAGLRSASPSSAAIVSQFGAPITAILSVIVLGETLHRRRLLGIILAMVGTLIIIWDPRGFTVSRGLLLVLAATSAGSVGAILIKQMEAVRPLQFQAWIALASCLPLAIISAATETGQWRALTVGSWPLVLAILYSGVGSSVIAHTLYYMMIQRYEANVVAPLTLMTPIFSIALGILLTHDQFGLRIALGTLIALGGVLIIVRRGKTLSLRLAAASNN